MESIKYIFKTFKKCFYNHGTNIVLPNIENVFLDFIFQLGLPPLAAEISVILSRNTYSASAEYVIPTNEYVSKYEHFKIFEIPWDRINFP